MWTDNIRTAPFNNHFVHLFIEDEIIHSQVHLEFETA